MNKFVFTVEHMENIFEIGRIMESMDTVGSIDLSEHDSKTLFAVGLELAQRFEMEYPETEDYYADIEVFATERLLERFGREN